MLEWDVNAMDKQERWRSTYTHRLEDYEHTMKEAMEEVMKEVEVGCRRDGGKRGKGVLIPIDWKPIDTCSGYNGERRTVVSMEEVGCRRRDDVGG